MSTKIKQSFNQLCSWSPNETFFSSSHGFFLTRPGHYAVSQLSGSSPSITMPWKALLFSAKCSLQKEPTFYRICTGEAAQKFVFSTKQVISYKCLPFVWNVEFFWAETETEQNTAIYKNNNNKKIF